MIISFEGPAFFAAADEDQFFGWLASLPEYRGVQGVGTTLQLELTATVSPDSVRQLVIIFRRWHVDLLSLQPLRSADTDNFVLWGTALGE